MTRSRTAAGSPSITARKRACHTNSGVPIETERNFGCCITTVTVQFPAEDYVCVCTEVVVVVSSDEGTDFGECDGELRGAGPLGLS